jgi:phenylalanyl-tRNA synthetase beta chain
MLSDFLAANGFYEAMSLSLSNSDYYTGEAAIFPIPAETLAYVHNTANQGLDCMRPTLLFGGLEAVRHNQNRRHPDLRLFEIGKTYRREQQGEKTIFPETQRLALFVTGARQPESWQPAGKEKTDFYTLKPFVVNILARLGISGYQETVLQPGEHQALQYGVRLHRGPQELAVFGQVSPAICKTMEIKNAVFIADLNLDNLLAAHGVNRVQYQELSKFPTVRRDLALVLDRRVPFGEVRQLAVKTAKKILKEVNLFDVFEDESKLGPGKKSYAVSFVFENPTKTLEDKEIDALMHDLQTAFETKLSALVRGG